jgi:hypothetical protein
VAHLRELPDSRRRVAQFALPIPASRCHGFSPWQLRSCASGAARGAEYRFLERITARFLRWLLTPCALRLREPHLDPKTSDALVVAPWCYRESSISRVRRSLNAGFRLAEVRFPLGLGPRSLAWD